MDVASSFIAVLFLIIIWFLLQSRKETEPPKQYGVPSTTLRGIPVKSHTERLIADYFTKNNIRYEYEPVVFSEVICN